MSNAAPSGPRAGARKTRQEPPKPASPTWAWVETLIVTVLFPALGWLIDHDDPLLRKRAIAWIGIAPLLVGLRHGFARAFVSAGALCAFVLVRERPPSSPTLEYCLGVFIIAMLAGEFTDVRDRRLRRAEASSEYRRTRLGEFTRAFHLLRISHDRLEQRLVGSTQSLRETLLDVQRQLRETQVGSTPMHDQAERILGLFTSLGLLQIAALYDVDTWGKRVTRAVACLGDPAALDYDPMIAEALEKRRMLHVQAMTTDARRSSLLAAVPLVDVADRVWGLLAVHQMPFIAFHEANLKLLSVLAGHVADMLAAHAAIPTVRDEGAHEFARQLKRCIDDRRLHDLRSCVLGLVVKERAISELLVDQIAHKWRRGLDLAWVLKNPTGAATIFILMPLTDMTGVKGYEARLNNQIGDEHGKGRVGSAIELRAFEVQPSDVAEEVIDRLARECRVDAPLRRSQAVAAQ